MAKKASKRCSERRKTKTVITNARKEAKLRRELNKNKRKAVKVPKSVLLTDDEKLQMKNIKEAAAMRAKELKPVETEDVKRTEQFIECIKHCDCFLEVIDFRDIEGTRNLEFENILKENKINSFVFVNHADSEFNADLSILSSFQLVSDFSQFSNFKKICIFGTNKVGKFVVTKEIERVCGDKEFHIIKTPAIKSGVSDVFRGTVDFKNINPKNMFESLWEFFEKDQLQEFFRISSFGDASGFLTLLADKISKDTLKTVTQDGAALTFFSAIRSGQIKWMKQSDRFIFKFINKN